MLSVVYVACLEKQRGRGEQRPERELGVEQKAKTRYLIDQLAGRFSSESVPAHY